MSKKSIVVLGAALGLCACVTMPERRPVADPLPAQPRGAFQVYFIPPGAIEERRIAKVTNATTGA